MENKLTNAQRMKAKITPETAKTFNEAFNIIGNGADSFESAWKDVKQGKLKCIPNSEQLPVSVKRIREMREIS
jgi:hypothetical protein